MADEDLAAELRKVRHDYLMELAYGTRESLAKVAVLNSTWPPYLAHSARGKSAEDDLRAAATDAFGPQAAEAIGLRERSGYGMIELDDRQMAGLGARPIGNCAAMGSHEFRRVDGRWKYDPGDAPKLSEDSVKKDEGFRDVQRRIAADIRAGLYPTLEALAADKVKRCKAYFKGKPDKSPKPGALPEPEPAKPAKPVKPVKPAKPMAKPSPEKLAMLKAELDKLDKMMAKFTPAAHKTMGAPAKKADFEMLSKTVFGGGEVPDELRIWFGWHNGESPTDDEDEWQDGFPPKLWFATAFDCMSIAESVKAWTEMKAISEEGDCQPWKTSWVPLFYHGGGNYVVYETAGKSAGKILTWWHDDDLDTEAKNLTALVKDLQELHSA